MKMSVATGAMSAMGPMPTSHSMPEMGSMPGMDMSSSGMNMVFFFSTTTPLFSNAWSPTTTAQYAGTCMFLIALTVTFRLLLALKTILENTTWAEGNLLLHRHSLNEKFQPDGGRGCLAGIRSTWSSRPSWNLRIDGWRAVLDTVLVGVGYLLMLAVMTMNIGYFWSVLGGSFLGSAIAGRFSSGGGASC